MIDIETLKEAAARVRYDANTGRLVWVEAEAVKVAADFRSALGYSDGHGEVKSPYLNRSNPHG